MAFKATLTGGGAWADSVELEEEQNGGTITAPLPSNDFPSLGESAKTAPPKGKKPKAQKMGFADFLAMPSNKPGAFRRAGGGVGATMSEDKNLSDKAILMQLPKGPSGRDDDSAAGGYGGGFDGERGGGYRRREDNDRPPREEMGPSRADEVNDWGATRTFKPTEAGRSGGYGGGGFSRDRDESSSREPREFRTSAADTTNDWGSTRKYEPSAPSTRGGGFDDRERDSSRSERRFEAPPPSKADQEDQWSRGRGFQASAAEPSSRPSKGFGGGFGGRDDSAGDREDKWNRRATDDSVTSTSSQPSERPRLKLAPRTAPLPESAAPPAAPASAASSESAELDSGSASASAEASAPKVKSNPFGAARPREEVLKEKGVDPIKEDLKHIVRGEVTREPTAEEESLKAEVEELRKKLEELTAAEETKDSDESKDISKQVDEKEKALLLLKAQEDDKVRFARSQKDDREKKGDDKAPVKSKW